MDYDQGGKGRRTLSVHAKQYDRIPLAVARRYNGLFHTGMARSIDDLLLRVDIWESVG